MYFATINTGGYLPDSADNAPTFETVKEAWLYLAEERDGLESDLEIDRSDGTNSLFSLSEVAYDNDYGAGIGSVSLPTPGYDGNHDLGTVYTVTEMEEDYNPNEDHEDL